MAVLSAARVLRINPMDFVGYFATSYNSKMLKKIA